MFGAELCAGKCRCQLRTYERLKLLGVRVRGGCKPADIDAGKQTRVFGKNSMHFYKPSFPCLVFLFKMTAACSFAFLVNLESSIDMGCPSGVVVIG